MHITSKINSGGITKPFFFFHFKGEVLFLLVLCKQAKECFLFKWVIICSLYCVKHDNSLLGWEAITSGGSNAQNLECCSRATFSHWLNIPSQYRILNILYRELFKCKKYMWNLLIRTCQYKLSFFSELEYHVGI